jgi:hypothetical protein
MKAARIFDEEEIWPTRERKLQLFKVCTITILDAMYPFFL